MMVFMCWKTAPKNSMLLLRSGSLLASRFLQMQMETVGEASANWKSTGINCWGRFRISEDRLDSIRSNTSRARPALRQGDTVPRTDVPSSPPSPIQD